MRLIRKAYSQDDNSKKKAIIGAGVGIGAGLGAYGLHTIVPEEIQKSSNNKMRGINDVMDSELASTKRSMNRSAEIFERDLRAARGDFKLDTNKLDRELDSGMITGKEYDTLYDKADAKFKSRMEVSKKNHDIAHNTHKQQRSNIYDTAAKQTDELTAKTGKNLKAAKYAKYGMLGLAGLGAAYSGYNAYKAGKSKGK